MKYAKQMSSFSLNTRPSAVFRLYPLLFVFAAKDIYIKLPAFVFWCRHNAMPVIMP